MSLLGGKKIILGISGGIAAYKTPILVRELIKQKTNVRVVMTPASKKFVTPLTLSTVSKNPVLHHLNLIVKIILHGMITLKSGHGLIFYS